MLLELAIGDAYGAGFEYADWRHIRARNDLSDYVQHPHHRRRPGTYTDDTQMTIALAEAIVEGLPWTPEVLADKFVAVFRRDPRSGYSGSFEKLLKQVADGADFLRKIRPDSNKSGAAMRAAPVGLFGELGEVIEKSEVQARITHDTPDGIAAAVAAALMVHYVSHELGPKTGIGWRQLLLCIDDN